MSDEAASSYTIDELATLTRVPSRTIRFYQSTGALQAPAIRGRVAYYGPAHVERLKLIGSLQDRGLRIDAIRDLLPAGRQGRAVAQRVARPRAAAPGAVGQRSAAPASACRARAAPRRAAPGRHRRAGAPGADRAKGRQLPRAEPGAVAGGAAPGGRRHRPADRRRRGADPAQAPGPRHRRADHVLLQARRTGLRARPHGARRHRRLQGAASARAGGGARGVRPGDGAGAAPPRRLGGRRRAAGQGAPQEAKKS